MRQSHVRIDRVGSDDSEYARYGNWNEKRMTAVRDRRVLWEESRERFRRGMHAFDCAKSAWVALQNRTLNLGGVADPSPSFEVSPPNVSEFLDLASTIPNHTTPKTRSKWWMRWVSRRRVSLWSQDKYLSFYHWAKLLELSTIVLTRNNSPQVCAG